LYRAGGGRLLGAEDDRTMKMVEKKLLLLVKSLVPEGTTTEYF
jgi:hypothetical protein